MRTKKKLRWSEEELSFLKSNINKMNNTQIASCLSRSVNSVRKMVTRSGVKRNPSFILQIQKERGVELSKIEKSSAHRANISKSLKSFHKKNPELYLGSKNPKWRGGFISDGHGRKLVYSPNHPNPSKCGIYVYEYRLIMEKKLKRYLKKNEVVHHKDGDHTNNHMDNLQVMTQSEHASIHGRRKKQLLHIT